MNKSDKGEKCFLASCLAFLAAFLVIDFGQADNTIAFRPDYHGGWWKAFAGSSSGKMTDGGAALLVIAAVVLFCLAIRFSNQSEKSE